MARARTTFKSKSWEYKNLKCQNSDLETSKYAKYAPLDGTCKEIVSVPENVERVLCFKCTMRSASGK